MSRTVLGDFEITLVREAVYWWDGGAFFGVVPKTLWSHETECDELNRIPAALNCYVIRTGAHTVLVETGAGDKMDDRARERAKLPKPAEPLPAVIARHGIDPDTIDTVINSHLHWDHSSGNTILETNGPVPAFPRAKYYAQRGEWEHAHERHPRDSVSYIDANYDPLLESGHLVLVDGDCEIVPGIWMRRAPGHNRDLCVITADSGKERFCFLSDLVPTAAHVRPTWVAAFDLYPLEVIETKTRWLTAASEGGWLCAFAHDVHLPFARIRTHPKAHFEAVAP